MLARVLLAYGLDRHEEAVEYLGNALDMAITRRLAPLILDIYLDTAQFLAQQHKLEHAAELLLLVEQHNASTHDSRQAASHHLNLLEGQLPCATIIALKERVKKIDLLVMAQSTLTELSSVDTQPDTATDYHRRRRDTQSSR